MKFISHHTMYNVQQLQWIKALSTLIKRNKIVVFTLIIVLILIDSLFVKISSDIIIFGILAMYGILAKVAQIKSIATFYLCLGILSVMFISFLFTQASTQTEKFTVWLFLFLVIGIIQQWRE